MINEYVEIVDYYDRLLTGGYRDFDYDDLSKTLYNLLGDKRKVLDIGVGTGLLAEKMISLANYEIVGIDFSSGMLEIAKQRLANSDVQLICQDITEFETEDKFEAIVSTGGAICLAHENADPQLVSHIIDREKTEQLLAKLYGFLDANGVLVLSIGNHILKKCKKEIKQGVLYEHKIELKKPYVDKWYVFSKANGEVLAEQFCRFYVFDGRETRQALSDAGFKEKYDIVDGKFLVCYK